MTSEEILQIFFVECDESLAAAEAGLGACRDGTQDADTVNAVFRAVHSIKGGAGAFGFTELQAYTHTFETLLSDVREGSVAIAEPLVEMLLRALDTLSDHVTAIREGCSPPEDGELVAELEAALAANCAASRASQPDGAIAVPPESDPNDELGCGLDAMLNDLLADFGSPASAPAPAESAEPSWTLGIRPSGGAMRNGSEPLLMLRQLTELGGTCVDCDCRRVPALEAFDVGQGYLDWTFAIPGHVDEAQVREIFDFIESECALDVGGAGYPDEVAHQFTKSPPAGAATASPTSATADSSTAPMPTSVQSDAAPVAAPAANSSQSIRIDLAKLDRLIDSVGELVIAQAMMAQQLAVQNVAAGEEVALLETLIREIQESAMSIRAQPIGSVFSRVPRILRELASSTGKHVRLEVSGEATELDKTVIERLGEPLTHLIRNAVDHGIESAAERLAAGKSAEGTLSLSAEHRAGRILIRIADDGRGIDREKVLAKAIEKGLVAPDAVLGNEDIDALIFAPGFSTAVTVSNVSGRGVGMDVVRQNVKELGGRITIESVQGEGTAFTLTLPLTLAISDGMIVTVGDQTLVVPLTHVVESLRPTSKDLQGLGAGRQMLNVRGQFIPVIPVGETIGAGGLCATPTKGVLIVVDTETMGGAALLVDDIVDQRQFVIKSLDTNYRAVECVAGATILGDGRVALILDVDGLVAASLAPAELLAA